MSLSFTVSDTIPASKEAIYTAWLDSAQHAKMTNTSAARASNKVGDTFMAHDDYITGINLELTPFSKIVQEWRSLDFSDEEESSVITVSLEAKDGGTLITLTHSKLPAHCTQYESGWQTHYFEPMKKYFAGLKAGSSS